MDRSLQSLRCRQRGTGGILGAGLGAGKGAAHHCHSRYALGSALGRGGARRKPEAFTFTDCRNRNHPAHRLCPRRSIQRQAVAGTGTLLLIRYRPVQRAGRKDGGDSRPATGSPIHVRVIGTQAAKRPSAERATGCSLTTFPSMAADPAHGSRHRAAACAALHSWPRYDRG